MQERDFFSTSDNILGVGPKLTKEDDCVAVIFGCNVLLVLRPVADNTYRIIGECYVFRIDEGVESREWEESGRPAPDILIV